MLTAKEKVELLRLEELEKNYTPLTDEELEKMENFDAYNLLYPPQLADIVKAWSEVIKTMAPIIEFNLRLIREIRYWREKENENT